ncbi:Tex family protein [Myxococcota bacterium]
MTAQQSAPFDAVPWLAKELGWAERNVAAAVALLADGATVPFIARYRKEATGGMDELQIRTIEERRSYLLELEDRRHTILGEIDKQGKLTQQLAGKIRACRTKAELEDLYLPYKPKRRTRASIAREKGLEPLADRMAAQPTDGDPRREALRFVDESKGVPDVEAALAGARDICAECVAEQAEVRRLVREAFRSKGLIRVRKDKQHAEAVTKFDAYGGFEEPIAKIPSHRFLAIRRGENEGVLRVELALAEDVVPGVEAKAGVNRTSPWQAELSRAVEDAYSRLLVPSVRTDLRVELKLSSDRAAVEVFAQNLRELLLAAPFGSRSVLGIDPGQRTGCKCAVVDETGAISAHDVLYLVQGEEAMDRARRTLLRLVREYRVAAVAVGNGTHGRETEAFVRETLRADDPSDAVACIPVNEAGASVYSASDVAREEFPDLDLTLRGAISIARRLQDPLAELVKIDPKSIGVGQYQHDVHQPLLTKKLDEVVESCVNQVGVELNTASAPLLARVAGIGPSLAKRIVEHRVRGGAFSGRRALLSVSGLGSKTFEQAAGFLRVRGAEHPLDASAVHPERYPLVEGMARDLNVPVASLIGNAEAVARIDASRYVAGDVGSFTLTDILAELKKPGRDPRSTFQAPCFRDDVRSLEDLNPGMVLEGVVTNVTAFGAFVDIGVHQDGLVHVSQLSDRFVREPSDVVRVGNRLKVRVLEVDLARRRISLSAKSEPTAKVSGRGSAGSPSEQPAQRGAREAGRGSKGKDNPASSGGRFINNPFASLLRK